MKIVNSKGSDDLPQFDEETFLRSVCFQQPENFLKTFLSDEREDVYQEFLIGDRD